MPSEEELARAEATLEERGNEVDYVVTHCAPSLVQARLDYGLERDRLTEFLEYLCGKVSFTAWCFGHYHVDRRFEDGFFSLYDDVVRLECAPCPCPPRYA